MNRDDVGKVLGAWVGKASKVSAEVDPLRAGDVGRNVSPINRTAATMGDDMAQLNFKVPQSMKSRIKQLAARDSITLLAMLYHMVDLYESEHGGLNSK
jgi:hypothetical protein